MNKATLVVVLVGILIMGFVAWQRMSSERTAWDGESGATPLEEMSRFSRIDAEREVVVHCGNSMRLALEQVAAEFQRRYGIAVVFNFGGSSELLPLIEIGGRGDLFMCHDPYASILEEKGLLIDYEVVGALRPIILVRTGNPRNIASLEDLGEAGLRVATVDPRYATAGQLVEAVLIREDWGAAVKNNIVIESRSHSDAALSLITGHVDAAVVWNFLTPLYPGQVEQIEPGVDFEKEVRMTMVHLTTSENQEEAAKFRQFLNSEFGRKVLAHYGYIDAEQD